jgi:hypothetical protein
MRKKHRIVLSVVIGTLAGGLVIALSLANREDEATGISAWDRAWWAFDDFRESLGWRNPRRCPSPCFANLKQIDGAKATWALENKKENSDISTASDLFGTNAYVRDTPMCPQGGTYSLRSVQQKPVCSHPGHTI